MRISGERIKRFREELEWSQEQLARELNICIATVGRWERDENPPSQMGTNLLMALAERKRVIL